MGMTDPIADLLVRIKTGIKDKKESVDVPASDLKIEIIKILKDEGFILKHAILTKNNKKTIRLTLKYSDKGRNIISDMKGVSRPGCRIYATKGKIPYIRSGMGIVILTTSRGVMTDTQARKAGVGGEMLCYVW